MEARMMVFPLAQIGTRKGVISDGYKPVKTATTRQHLGCDLLYHRDVKIDGVWRKGDTTGSKNFIMLADALAVACCDAEVVKVAKESSGIHVKLRALTPVKEFGITTDTHFLYLHNKWACVVKGQVVTAGTVIARPGDDPRNPSDPEHIHFGQRRGAFGPYEDPTAWLKKATHVKVKVR